jgi:phosphate transport system protein
MPRETFHVLLTQLEEQILSMGSMVEKAVGRAMDSLIGGNSLLAQHVIDADNEIDAKRYEIENQCLQLLATQQPLATDLRIVAATLSIATDLERMGDHAEGIAHLTQRMSEEFAVKPPAALMPMANRVTALLHEALDAYLRRDAEAARRILDADDDIDAYYQDNLRVLLTHMMEDPRTITRATYLLWVDHNLERIGDRISNIAERTIFIVTG